MSSAYSLTDKDRQKLAQLQQKHREQGRPNAIPNCQQIRDSFQDGETVETLANNYDVKPGAIRYHLKGKCECNADTDSLELRGRRNGKYIYCPHTGCQYNHRKYERVTEHINRDHTGGN